MAVEKWSDADIRILRVMYPTHNITEVVETLGRSEAAVRLKASKLKLGKRPQSPWTPERDAELKARYPIEGSKLMAEEWNVSQSNITTRANNFGIFAGGHVGAAKRRSEKLKTCNIHYFDEWSPNMAYVLGFIFADGSITKRQTDVTISVVCTDEAVLQFIKDETQSKRPIYHTKGKTDNKGFVHKDFSTFVLGSKVLTDKVMELGVKPAKTYGDDPFPEVPDEFIRDFIRGYLDGDGTICLTSQGICKVGFVGTVKLITGIRNALHEQANLFQMPVKIEPHKRAVCARVSWSAKKDLQRFCRFIYYKGRGFCLRRKRDKLVNWLKNKT